MYNNESFEEYIRQILGYPTNNYNVSFMNEPNMRSNQMSTNEELEKYYPEIYKVVYPMINNRCSRITEPISQELIDQVTEEIASAIEPKEISLNINLHNEISNNKEERVENKTKDLTSVSSTDANAENREEQKRIGRFGSLEDLIKILVIRELLGRPGSRQQRPPFPPPRPCPGPGPCPGGPFPPGGRPPVRPRGYYDFMDIYEM